MAKLYRRKRETVVSDEGSDSIPVSSVVEPIGEPDGSVNPDLGARDSGGDGGDGAVNPDGGIRTKRKYTRRNGVSSGAAQKGANVSAIEASLLGIHGMLAIVLKTPEIALSPDEGKLLAKSLADVSKHYAIPVVTDKQMALGMLAVALFTVYGGKIKAIKARRTGVDNTPAPTVASTTPTADGSGFGVFNLTDILQGNSAA